MTSGGEHPAPSRWRAYRAVDAAGDPGSLSGQLDGIASVAAVAAEKQRAAELLRLQPGSRVLDVGCGNGPDLGRLAEMVGPGGRVVGLDRSAGLIEVARARGPTGAGSIELVVGDAGALPFEAGEFDACRADRTLQHLADPQASLAEIARVTRSGGRVVVTESRWGLVAPSLDREVTGCVLSVMATEAERASWLGDRLPSLLDRAGLTGVEVTSTDVNLDDFDDIARFINLGWSLDAAVRAGSISRARAEDWTGGLRDLTGRGDAFVLVLFLHVSADKP